MAKRSRKFLKKGNLQKRPATHQNQFGPGALEKWQDIMAYWATYLTWYLYNLL